jgi:hypothetical protein
VQHGESVKKEKNIVPMCASGGRKVTEVSVGVIVQSDGSYLLAQRMQGKPYEGYWEIKFFNIANENPHHYLTELQNYKEKESVSKNPEQ